MPTDQRGSPLTLARRAVINAIQHWKPLANTFKSRYYLEHSTNTSRPPDYRTEPSGIADLPAIRVIPSLSAHSWHDSQATNDPYTLECSMWFPWGHLADAELTYAEVLFALYNSKPDGAVLTFLGEIGCRLVQIQNLRLDFPVLGDSSRGIRAVRFTFGIAVPLILQPLLPPSP